MENRSEQEIVYGRRPVAETLRSGRPVHRLYVLAGARGIPREFFATARERAIPVVHVDRVRLDRLARQGNHQGVVAAVGTRDFVSLQEVLERPLGSPWPAFFLVLDGIQDPGNLGALLRTAEGAGVHGVIVPGAGSCGLTAAVTRAAAGADQFLPVARVEKLGPVLRQLREGGFEVVGASAEGSEVYTAVDFRLPTALVLGAEGRGLASNLVAQCTRLVRIPLLGQVGALNVSAAGAILLYEAVRQRQA
jgi:23S rRNA (guanosine2251-2'-O)-methyltransferase